MQPGSCPPCLGAVHTVITCLMFGLRIFRGLLFIMNVHGSKMCHFPFQDINS